MYSANLGEAALFTRFIPTTQSIQVLVEFAVVAIGVVVILAVVGVGVLASVVLRRMMLAMATASTAFLREYSSLCNICCYCSTTTVP